MPPDLFGGTSESTQKRRFTPEAKEALRREVPLFLQISPLLNQLMQGALQPEGPGVGQGVRHAGESVLPAVESAGIAAGLDTATLTDILQNLDPSDPAFQDILRQLSLSVSTSVPAIVDPRFAVGLRPSTETQTTSTPSPFSIGTSLGGLALGGAALCWIALRLYGVTDLRFYLARSWIADGLCRTRHGRLVVRLYQRWGRQVARSAILCRCVKPLLDRAWRRQLEEQRRHG